jgi:hypothetical protein
MDMNEIFEMARYQEWRGSLSTWKCSRLPGGIKLSSRQRFIPGSDTRRSLLIEDIVLEEMPLELEQLPRRR